MARFLHIFITPKSGVTPETIRERMNKAVDWYRYNPGTYVVLTTSDVDRWYSRLEEFVKPEGELLILELNVESAQGWMSKEFWSWVEEAKAKAKAKSNS